MTVAFKGLIHSLVFHSVLHAYGRLLSSHASFLDLVIFFSFPLPLSLSFSVLSLIPCVFLLATAAAEAIFAQAWGRVFISVFLQVKYCFTVLLQVILLFVYSCWTCLLLLYSSLWLSHSEVPSSVCWFSLHFHIACSESLLYSVDCYNNFLHIFIYTVFPRGLIRTEIIIDQRNPRKFVETANILHIFCCAFFVLNY